MQKYKAWDINSCEFVFIESDDPYSVKDVGSKWLMAVGTQDKNGRDVYENDLVILENGSDGVVLFDGNKFTVFMSNETSIALDNTIEVIGNMNQHFPEDDY